MTLDTLFQGSMDTSVVKLQKPWSLIWLITLGLEDLAHLKTLEPTLGPEIGTAPQLKWRILNTADKLRRGALGTKNS